MSRQEGAVARGASCGARVALERGPACGESSRRNRRGVGYGSLVMRSASLLFSALVLLVMACSSEHKPATVAHEVEDRLLAPCCWRGTLRDHSSELAHQLRGEIERRAAAGESGGAIESDLIQRYGEQIRALPAGRDPRWVIAAGFVALAGFGLVVLARVRRARSGGAAASDGSPSASQVSYEDRLDEELAAVD